MGGHILWRGALKTDTETNETVPPDGKLSCAARNRDQ